MMAAPGYYVTPPGGREERVDPLTNWPEKRAAALRDKLDHQHEARWATSTTERHSTPDGAPPREVPPEAGVSAASRDMRAESFFEATPSALAALLHLPPGYQIVGIEWLRREYRARIYVTGPDVEPVPEGIPLPRQHLVLVKTLHAGCGHRTYEGSIQ